MTIKVYHTDWTSSAPRNSREAFDLVAFAKTDDLEKAFELTNTIENYWWENEDVLEIVINTRSTSVGDVMVDESTDKAYIVDVVGFNEIDWFK